MVMVSRALFTIAQKQNIPATDSLELELLSSIIYSISSWQSAEVSRANIFPQLQKLQLDRKSQQNIRAYMFLRK